MKLALNSTLIAVLFAAGSAAAAGPQAQDLLAHVQTLYALAAYEDALAAMPVPSGSAARDVEQYRALCLLALGRQQEAIAAVDRLITQDPLFAPAQADTPPRLQSLFADARARLIPAIVKTEYAEAKAAWEKKDRSAAHAAFQRTLDLIGTVPDEQRAALSDLRVLAGEFLQLSEAVAASAPVASATPAERGASGVPDESRMPTDTVAASQDSLGPVAVRQSMPLWQPPDPTARRSEYHGIIRLAIDSAGRVEKVTVVKRSHPAYDAAIERVAPQWLFKPATRNGLPVASQKDINVTLRPQ